MPGVGGGVSCRGLKVFGGFGRGRRSKVRYPWVASADWVRNGTVEVTGEMR